MSIRGVRKASEDGKKRTLKRDVHSSSALLHCAGRQVGRQADRPGCNATGSGKRWQPLATPTLGEGPGGAHGVSALQGARGQGAGDKTWCPALLTPFVHGNPAPAVLRPGLGATGRLALSYADTSAVRRVPSSWQVTGKQASWWGRGASQDCKWHVLKSQRVEGRDSQGGTWGRARFLEGGKNLVLASCLSSCDVDLE